MARRLLLTLVLLAGASRLRAGSDLWTSGGPDGGFIYAFAIDPSHSSTLYAASNQHFYKSTDGGLSWTTLSLTQVSRVAVSPSDSNMVYTDKYRSSDGGRKWAPMTSILVGATDPITGYVRELAVDSRDPRTLYAGFEANPSLGVLPSTIGVAKSSDAGQTWTIGFSTPGTVRYIDGFQGFAVSPDASPRIYQGVASGAGSFSVSIYVSGDGGATWTSAAVGPLIVNLAAARGLLAYAGTYQGGVLKTADGGMTWTPANVGLPDFTSAIVAVDPSDASTVYATTSGGLFRSTDAAASWILVDPNPSLVYVTVDPTSSRVLYSWGGSSGVSRSDDGGATWAIRSAGIHDAQVSSVAVDPSNPLTVFAGEIGRISRSDDGGSSWTDSTTGVPSVPIVDVLVDPRASRFVYAAMYSYPTVPSPLIRSTDGGLDWSPSTTGLPSGLSATSLASSPEGTIFAGTTAGVFRSTDHGASWSGSLRDQSVVVVRVNPADGRVWAGTQAGLYSSSDGGATWTLEDFEGLTIYALDAVGSEIYAMTADGLRKRTPTHGWVLDTALPTSIRCVRIDPRHPEHVYVSNSEGVYQSLNAGAGWTSMNNGNVLPLTGFGSPVGEFEIDSSGTRLYASTYPGGVVQYQRSHRVVFPAAATLHGIAPAYFHSDASVFNASDRTATVTATYRCLAESCADPTRTVVVPPRQVLALDDVVAQLFGEPETGGAIELDSDQPILATSRLYTPGKPAPTLGMFIPALRPDQSYSQSVLTSLSHSTDLSAGSRTNIGVFNPYDDPETIRISLYDPDGTQLGVIERPLSGHDGVQINDGDLWSEAGVAGDVPSFYAVVDADTAAFAYGVVIDNQSLDPIFVVGRENKLLPSVVAVIPAAASIHGAGDSFFHSDVSILNLSDTDDSLVQLSASCFLGFCPGAAASMTIAPRQSVLLQDLLGTTFALPETGAAIEIAAGWPISVSSRLYTPSHPDPTVGMYVPGLTGGESAPHAVLSSLSYSPSAGSGSRVNVGAYNGGEFARVVTFRLYRGSGELLGEASRGLGPGGGIQLNDFFRQVGVTAEVPSAYCVVSADDFGPLYAYAAVIDNQSQDPIFVVGQPDPCADAPCSP